jgi:uroporphyrinogen decarboxylase
MNDLFLRACRGEAVDKIPVWFMRQAGRSLPGYRKLRETHDVLSLTRTPELAAQVSMEPIQLLGVDAAILFADIMLLPIAMGIDVEIVENVGPVIDKPITTPDDLKRLQPFDQSQVEFLGETIRLLRSKLDVPVIGFAGAPFTLASYLIEGKPSRTWLSTKKFMLQHPDAWDELMTKLADATVEYLRMQISAGAQAVQLFDSWVGCLSPAQYRAQVLPHVQRIFSALGETGVPRIHFGTNTAGMLGDFANVECEVVGVDWRMSLVAAKHFIGGKTLQGNLDPAMLLAPWKTLAGTVDDMLSQINPKQGYIFNLGHGVVPEADDKVLKRLVEYVHSK